MWGEHVGYSMPWFDATFEIKLILKNKMVNTCLMFGLWLGYIVFVFIPLLVPYCFGEWRVHVNRIGQGHWVIARKTEMLRTRSLKWRQANMRIQCRRRVKNLTTCSCRSSFICPSFWRMAEDQEITMIGLRTRCSVVGFAEMPSLNFWHMKFFKRFLWATLHM